MTDPRHDVIIIGAGAGGLCAAARLTLEGVRPLVLEAADRVGGRFSTIEKDGFKLPTGAIAIELSGPFYETFGLVGADIELRSPDPLNVVRVRGRDYNAGSTVWKQLVKRVTKTAGAVADGLGNTDPDDVDASLTLEAWVRRYTRSKTMLTFFDSLSASIFTVNADELPAGVMFKFLRETGGYKRFGFAPRGNIEPARALATAIEKGGGEVRLGWRVTSIVVVDGKATGVRAVDPGGREQTIEAKAVISNAGPHRTAILAKGIGFDDAFAARNAPVELTSMLALAFTADEDIVPHPGVWTFTDSKRVCNLANLTATCPDLAPPGKRLYEAYSVPRPSVGGVFDEEFERSLLEEDLRRFIPKFDRAETVLFKALHDWEAPAQQCRPGYDPGIETPIPHLVEVGDGVKPFGWIGTTACAETARLAVEHLVSGPLSPAARELVTV